MMKRVINYLKKQQRRYLSTRPVGQWPMPERIIRAMQLYKQKEGHTFDVFAPVLFTEKIVWYKLFYRHPDMTRICDKYLFKDYIAEKLGPGWTAPLYGMWTDVGDLERDWDSLPNQFCLKSNSSSFGRNIKIIRDKNSVDTQMLFQEVKKWLDPMNTGINSCSRAYYGVTPRVIAEKLLEGNGSQLCDYKVLCFDGAPAYIACISDRFVAGVDISESFYDTKWNKLPAVNKGRRNDDYERPQHLQQMLDVSAKLSQGFPQIRVDFYEVKGRLYIGELTFYSGFQFESKVWDRIFSEKFNPPQILACREPEGAANS